MQSLLFIVGGLGFVGLIPIVYANFTAPEGFEDEEGFHALHSADADQ